MRFIEVDPLRANSSPSAGSRLTALVRFFRKVDFTTTKSVFTSNLRPYSPTGFVAPNRDRDGLIVTYTFVSDASGQIALFRDGVQIGSKAP